LAPSGADGVTLAERQVARLEQVLAGFLLPGNRKCLAGLVEADPGVERVHALKDSRLNSHCWDCPVRAAIRRWDTPERCRSRNTIATSRVASAERMSERCHSAGSIRSRFRLP